MTERQLHLFRHPTRQRGIKPPPAKEFALHCMIADTCRHWIRPEWRGSHLPFGEYRNIATAARLKRMYTTPGWPDFVFFGPKRSAFFLELKRSRGGRLTEAQKDIAAHLKKCRFDYLCTSSYDEAISKMVKLGILRAMEVA